MSKDEIIRRNWHSVNERVQQACERGDRSPDEVRVVAVTKTVGLEEMQVLLESGAEDFGENRVPEAARKFAEVPESYRFRRHMIGHLQRNKVRQALSTFDTFHSIDSVRLAREVEKEAAKAGTEVPVLIQVNVARESQKHGADTRELEGFVQEVAEMPHLKMEGLMAMAPFVDDPEEVRPVLRQLREMRELLSVTWPQLSQLSMGMTQDFEVAIEEGATLVRVGSALFKGL